jgi:hypothetical protein
MFAALAALLVSGCMTYRQSAMGVTPAPQSRACPDVGHGCGKTAWSFLWGVAQYRYPKSAECGNVGLQEVTVRSTPLMFVMSTATAGLVSPRRIEWKCAAPAPSEGHIGGMTSHTRSNDGQ